MGASWARTGFGRSLDPPAPPRFVFVGNSEAASTEDALVQKNVLKGHDFAQSASKVPAMKDLYDEIATKAGAIGWGASGYASEKMSMPEHPVIGRPLTFYTIGVPSEKIQRLLRFIQGEGRKHHAA